MDLFCKKLLKITLILLIFITIAQSTEKEGYIHIGSGFLSCFDRMSGGYQSLKDIPTRLSPSLDSLEKLIDDYNTKHKLKYTHTIRFDTKDVSFESSLRYRLEGKLIIFDDNHQIIDDVKLIRNNYVRNGSTIFYELRFFDNESKNYYSLIGKIYNPKTGPYFMGFRIRIGKEDIEIPKENLEVVGRFKYFGRSSSTSQETHLQFLEERVYGK